MKRRFSLTAFCGAALFCIAAEVPAREAETGKQAPALEARTLDGAPFTLAAQNGKVVIVNFWATWCGPCRAEMPALDAFYRRHRDEGLVVLAVSADAEGDLQKVREAMRSFSFPAAMMSATTMTGYGRIRSIPQTYVIDTRGMLQRDGFSEKGTVDAETLERVVTALLHPSPVPSKTGE